MAAVLIGIILIGYLTAAVFYVAGLYDIRWERWATTGAVAGWWAQTAWLIVNGVATRTFPAVTLYDWVAFFVWLTAGFYLWGGRRIFPRHVGGFLFPILFLLWLVSQTLAQREAPVPGVGRDAWLALHITLATASYGAFLLSAVFGIMYIEKERELKEKRVRVFYYQLPPLDLMDTYGARLITLGVPLLMAAMSLGAIGAKGLWGYYWSWTPKETWSFFTWLIYVLYLLLRWMAGWRGHRAAVFSMAAFLLVVVNFFGINLLFHGVHDYNF